MPALKELYEKDRVVRLIPNHIARRQRNQTETKVERMQHLLQTSGTEISRGDITRRIRAKGEGRKSEFLPYPSSFVLWSALAAPPPVSSPTSNRFPRKPPSPPPTKTC